MFDQYQTSARVSRQIETTIFQLDPDQSETGWCHRGDNAGGCRHPLVSGWQPEHVDRGLPEGRFGDGGPLVGASFDITTRTLG